MKKYQIIYADPAWDYHDEHRRKEDRFGGGAKGHYQTMDIDDIKKLPIQELSDQNCMLFIWVTFPLLQEGLDVIRAWGFDYKTLGFSWIKTNKRQLLNQYSFLPTDLDTFFGIGYYTKSNCEVCLIGVKGKPYKISDSVSSVVLASRREHSRKPDEVRDRIIELCGDLPRIELFARQKTEGWDVWGNEVESDIDLMNIR